MEDVMSSVNHSLQFSESYGEIERSSVSTMNIAIEQLGVFSG